MMLNRDLISDILGRVDGRTLANAGCVSSEFWSVARQERIWEEACCSMWPSVEDTDVKKLISSSLGGFRNFYASCFPFVVYGSTLSDSNCRELEKLSDRFVVPSDFVSVVDVQYKNKFIYSKVVLGIPAAEDFEGWFCTCPFRVDLLNYNEDHAITDGLPTIVPLDKQRKGSDFWEQFMENIRLSWIVINRRTGQAANLSSWIPLSGKRDWPSDKDFVMCFGSTLPAHNILPCKTVQCKLVMKCRLSDGGNTSLKITELSMQLEDMMGAHVNGRRSLAILERALECTRSKNHNQILESYQKYLREQSKLREAKMRSEGCLDTLFILGGIVAFAVFCFFAFRLRTAIF
ncbi:hypothetical protein SUGI_1184620 [Cryptomeria japonica]|uniref:probable F-box protein At2g36090 n=1 Tax=Cryptomeria japonica TaxID=3369 RepID=UPI002414BD83|nr:probable F-box protein At2g36090 [Cryptomeria japonica]GLJ55207.1 hypothetical protein SUGI_1184620 [Cryptomeria japonica]